MFSDAMAGGRGEWNYKSLINNGLSRKIKV
jgi:hypothetical protein